VTISLDKEKQGDRRNRETGETETGEGKMELSTQVAVRSAQEKLKNVTIVFEDSRIFPSLTHKVCYGSQAR
jgi:hypothetical protein